MRHLIVLPDLGQTTTEAKVIAWRKLPGEFVSRGEPLLAVETDKVDMDVESFVDGYLREILVEAGAIATALKPVAILTDDPEEVYGEIRERVAAPAVETACAAGPGTQAMGGSRTAASPAAKALARQLGVRLNEIAGSGWKGLIVRRDLQRFVETRPEEGMAGIVSRSKREIPHFYASIDADVARAEAWRGRWNADHPGLRASWNDIFMRCAAAALREVPRLKTRFDSANDLLMVVANESGLALVEAAEPDALPWESYVGRMRVAVQRGTRTMKALSGDGSRPSLAVSNLGMFEVKEFAAIIPPGCTAVLAIGAVRDAPVVRDDRVEAGKICTLTLSADHRVIDGVTAARFLERIQFHLNSL